MNGMMLDVTFLVDRTLEEAGVAPDHALDITALRCPMTFVHTRLALDRMRPGETLLVTVRGEEPFLNVPRAAAALGHEILAQEWAEGTGRILIRKA
jgi:tRNA 2-thiouridine synthesizing protein A